MYDKKKYAFKFLFQLALSLVLALSLGWLCPENAFAQRDDDDSAPPPEVTQVKYKLRALAYVSCWSHDATGYHPSVVVRVENASGKDLTGIPVKFQARFQDLRNGFVTVARKDVRIDFAATQNINLVLRGPRAFELPIEPDLWPIIEFKLMCRVGDVGDDGTQTLLVARLDSVTMTDEDSMTRLSNSKAFTVPPPSRPLVPGPPLSAKAGTLGAAGTPAEHHGQPGKKGNLGQFLSNGAIPGLGDDFYAFEKTFGRPVKTETKDKSWVWAIYRKTLPSLNIVVGSHGHSGKADIVVVTVPADQVQNEAQVVSLTRSMSGPFKSEQPSQPSHSVRYLPNGRLEVSTMAARSYRASIMSPEMPNVENCFVMAISRLPGNIQRLLSVESQRRDVLRFLAPMLKDDESDSKGFD